jgi:hypothetical protein
MTKVQKPSFSDGFVRVVDTERILNRLESIVTREDHKYNDVKSVYFYPNHK